MDISSKKSRRPIIGITGATESKPSPHTVLPRSYAKAVADAGGLPVVLPVVSETAFPFWIHYLDGLILSGGTDINPLFYDQAPRPALTQIDTDRDTYELELTKAWLTTGKPLLGIGRGMQILVVAEGGCIHQDLLAEKITTNCHSQIAPLMDPCHTVRLEPDSTLARFLEADGECWVNSLHHQAAATVPSGYRVTARAFDGVIEGIEVEGDLPILGVQWHPEAMRDKTQRSLFMHFVKSATLLSSQTSSNRSLHAP